VYANHAQPQTVAEVTTDFVLGCDLDGVVGDYLTFFRDFVAGRLGKDPESLPPATSWRFADCGWGIRDDQHFSELHQAAVLEGRMFSQMDVMPGASETLWKLSDAGVWIRIITHRLCVNWGHQIAATDTIAWLDQPKGVVGESRPRIPYRDLCFIGDKPDVGADLYIDDAPHNVLGLREAGQRVICFEAPYNLELPGPRARDWDEVDELVELAIKDPERPLPGEDTVPPRR
jgi:5'(3')-deoxyribonucleotidase